MTPSCSNQTFRSGGDINDDPNNNDQIYLINKQLKEQNYINEDELCDLTERKMLDHKNLSLNLSYDNKEDK